MRGSEEASSAPGPSGKSKLPWPVPSVKESRSFMRGAFGGGIGRSGVNQPGPPEGCSGKARKTSEDLRAGGVRRDIFVEDGVGGSLRSMKPRMLRPLRLSSISLSSSSPRKACALGESGILVGGWRFRERVGRNEITERGYLYTREVAISSMW